MVPSPTPPSQPTSTPPSTSTETITPALLSHLLRLSALPQPGSAAEERQMLATLEAQLGFVRAARGVDTRGVAPLRAIRDETAAGRREQAVGVAALRAVLEGEEEVVGHARRPRRRRRNTGQQLRQQGAGAEAGAGAGEKYVGDAGNNHKENRENAESWDALGGASETAGRFFVVRSGGDVDSSTAKTDKA
ncbi:hypothetical protein SLS62_004228 [Diatrype stigma]|uniref:Glutamyl-tRNA amidotransferase complex subunit Gta3 domain-containing protein n=1 Tax=Diatrype stigma TaxID=117547 RepID=A0AAN9UVB1_9PEZI